MPTLTKKMGFSASHYYWIPDWSEAQNRDIFGACANRHGHGHNYRIEISIEGALGDENGMVINFFDLDPLLQYAVLDTVEHKNLNEEVPFFKARQPTLENIAIYLWNGLAPAIGSKGLSLSLLKVIEDDNLFVEFNGRLAECSY